MSRTATAERLAKPCRKCGAVDRYVNGKCRPCAQSCQEAQVPSQERMTKPCVKCGKTERYPATGNCRPCNVERLAAYNQTHRAENVQRSRSYAKRHPEQMAKNSQSLTSRYGRLVRGDWKQAQGTLSLEEYRTFEGKPCHYCQFPRPLTGCGLDRIDNTIGHVLSNVLPCCTECNHARNKHLTVSEMEQEIGPAIRRIKLARQGVASLEVKKEAV